jgi:hypothetical protein
MQRDLSVFDRYNADLQGPAGLFNQAYREHFHRLVRTAIIEHAIEVWGVRHFKRLIFKMPNESHAADFISDAFPEAFLVHLIRDGRDVMSSRFGKFSSGVLDNTKDPGLRKHAIAFYSHFWNFQNDIIEHACRRHATERVLAVRYEDLRRDLLDSALKIYDWMGSPLTRQEVEALATSVDITNAPPEEVGYGKRRGDAAIGRFKTVFSEEEVNLMNRIMGPLLRQYGYLESE